MQYKLVIYDSDGKEYLEFIYDSENEAESWGEHFCESHPECSFMTYPSEL